MCLEKMVSGAATQVLRLGNPALPCFATAGGAQLAHCLGAGAAAVLSCAGHLLASRAVHRRRPRCVGPARNSSMARLQLCVGTSSLRSICKGLQADRLSNGVAPVCRGSYSDFPLRCKGLQCLKQQAGWQSCSLEVYPHVFGTAWQHVSNPLVEGGHTDVGVLMLILFGAGGLVVWVALAGLGLALW